ncbi:hypothetical protein EDEG_00255 [Edhazardia aedis USNM 41457]|uniref:DNA-directed RNA polymerase II subunit RPB7 n=1 Tax=Edhazardia aedis (strain USNM 41457) TaxID=1003232 RepID=J8ZT02_EDHAE|nr:hypothetical protein EDEG_00255 [Edhazardia aedis USNM 41457]|eukprot:EJW02798.1 hypothetical protein EDEG_00255 [Edhazardia aedis USNM 41457]
MFFTGELFQTIYIPPFELSHNITQIIQTKLYKTVVGTCSQENGLIIMVLDILTIDGGKISTTGHVVFKVNYKALLLKPIKSEIIDAPIVDVNAMGVFCEAGPLTIFVSSFHIKEKIWKNNELKKNDKLRIKIIGTKIDSKRPYAIGTIQEEHLGKIA